MNTMNRKTDAEIFNTVRPVLQGQTELSKETTAALVEIAKRWANERAPREVYQFREGDTLWFSQHLLPCTVEKTLKNKDGCPIGVVVKMNQPVGLPGLLCIRRRKRLSMAEFGKRLFMTPWEAVSAIRTR